MKFANGLKAELESEEQRSVGTSFGGVGKVSTSYSIVRIRDWILENYKLPAHSALPVVESLTTLAEQLQPRIFQGVIVSATRFSFLIELTDLKVGSTKMKTRWLPGQIQMPQHGSFEPVLGSFEPGNDQRSASFDECYGVFERALALVVAAIEKDADAVAFLTALQRQTRVPYEFPFGYQDPAVPAVHARTNVGWIQNDDILWLVKPC
jgi:hypothetical protein